ncbi:unnamed protein product [Dovyalis caffra]|uniref:RRM domain-containing protein n=1 Tax=Dovyalis caffra TaxID=77055 RepID=A0AAV1RDC8_9ROSI|nr:unnamed protein product [Dovyalis caffra]
MANRLGFQLFVGRLSSYSTNHELKRLFSPFGVVTEARLVVDPRTQKPKGYGFVTFESETDAQKALKTMNGRNVAVATLKAMVNMWSSSGILLVVMFGILVKAMVNMWSSSGILLVVLLAV